MSSWVESTYTDINDLTKELTWVSLQNVGVLMSDSSISDTKRINPITPILCVLPVDISFSLEISLAMPGDDFNEVAFDSGRDTTRNKHLRGAGRGLSVTSSCSYEMVGLGVPPNGSRRDPLGSH